MWIYIYIYKTNPHWCFLLQKKDWSVLIHSKKRKKKNEIITKRGWKIRSSQCWVLGTEASCSWFEAQLFWSSGTHSHPGFSFFSLLFNKLKFYTFCLYISPTDKSLWQSIVVQMYIHICTHNLDLRYEIEFCDMDLEWNKKKSKIIEKKNLNFMLFFQSRFWSLFEMVTKLWQN